MARGTASHLLRQQSAQRIKEIEPKKPLPEK